MPHDQLGKTIKCLNCGSTISGSFCESCGQKVIDETDRSLSTLIAGFFGNILFLDGRFMISLRYLFFNPGRMTFEFLTGKRKKFVPPVTLFLFANLIYFFLNPITDYSLSLHDQITYQFYSSTANSMVEEKINEKSISIEDYSLEYGKSSDQISKTIMILNIPMIALFVYALSFRKREFYFDSLVFTFHFFTFFLLCISIGDAIDDLLLSLLPESLSIIQWIWFLSFILIVPAIYGVLSFRKYLEVNWLWAIAGGVAIILGIVTAQMFYRLIIFLLTFWST